MTSVSQKKKKQPHILNFMLERQTPSNTEKVGKMCHLQATPKVQNYSHAVWGPGVKKAEMAVNFN